MDNVVNGVLSVCLPLSGVSAVLRELLHVRSTYGLSAPLHCHIISEQRRFSSFSITTFAQCYWMSSGFVALWDLGTEFFFVHLYMSLTVSLTCTYKMGEKQSLDLKEML